MKYYDKNDLKVINETKKKYLPERLVKCDDNITIAPDVCILNKIFTEWNEETELPIEYLYIYKALYPNSYAIEIKLKGEKPTSSPCCYSNDEFFVPIVSTLFNYNKTLSSKFNKALEDYFSYTNGYMYEDKEDFQYQIREKYRSNNPSVGNTDIIPIEHIEAIELVRAFRNRYIDIQYTSQYDLYAIMHNETTILNYITDKFLNVYNDILDNNCLHKRYFNIEDIESKWEEMPNDTDRPYNGIWHINLNYIKNHNTYIPLICDSPANIANQLLNFSILYGTNIIGLDSMDSELEKRLVVNIISRIYLVNSKYTKNEQYQGITVWDKTMEEMKKENNNNA